VSCKKSVFLIVDALDNFGILNPEEMKSAKTRWVLRTLLPQIEDSLENFEE